MKRQNGGTTEIDTFLRELEERDQEIQRMLGTGELEEFVIEIEPDLDHVDPLDQGEVVDLDPAAG